MRKTKEEIRNLELARKQVLKQFFQLSDKAMTFIEDSIDATKICGHCAANGEATRVDQNGKCLVCHGSMKVPDVARREWAADEINSRNAPKPKPMEMTVGNKTDFEEMEKNVAKLSDEEINQQIASLGIVVKDE